MPIRLHCSLLLVPLLLGRDARAREQEHDHQDAGRRDGHVRVAHHLQGNAASTPPSVRARARAHARARARTHARARRRCRRLRLRLWVGLSLIRLNEHLEKNAV